jgi:hypothetical protein
MKKYNLLTTFSSYGRNFRYIPWTDKEPIYDVTRRLTPHIPVQLDKKNNNPNPGYRTVRKHHPQ